jgi:DNA repair exonuclease SbcCD ATPase subunit
MSKIEQLEQILDQKNIQINELENQVAATSTQGSSELAVIQEREKQYRSELAAKSQQVQNLETSIKTLQADFEDFRNSAISQEDYQAAMEQNKSSQIRMNELIELQKQLTSEKIALIEKIEKTKPETGFDSGIPKPVFQAEITKTHNLSELSNDPKPVFQREGDISHAPIDTDADAHRIYSGEGRNICPKCNATKIKEVQDKTRIISYAPTPVYAKKFQCSRCGFEWI